MTTRPASGPAGGDGPVEGRVGYLPALDGLRAVSVVAVVAFHLGLLRGGFLGVDVFFVISGYLITRLLLAEHERSGSISLRRFWSRRFRRLVPALAVVLVVVAVASRAWLPGWRLGGIRDDALSALAYVANWRFSWSGQSYFAQGVGPSPLRHTWSLAIEEQFYVVWPLVVVGAVALAARSARWPARRVVGAVAASVTVASALGMALAAGVVGDLSRLYYGTDTRVFALAAGSWLATWLDGWLVAPPTRVARRRRLERASAIGAAALAWLVVLVLVVAEDEAASYRVAFQATAVLATVAVAGVVAGRGALARVLASPPFRWVGRRSYGIYLWSWPVQVIVTARFDLGAAPLAAVVAVASIALATASFALVEEPIRTGRRAGAGRGSTPTTERPRRVPGLAFGAVGIVAVVAVVAGVAVGAPDEPGYLRTSTEDVAATALRPAVAPPADPTTTTTAPGAAPTTAVPGPGGTSVLGSAAPGPLDAGAPLLVPTTAQVDPASVHGRTLRVLMVGDSVGWSIGVNARPEDLTVDLTVDARALLLCGILPPDARWIAGDRAPAVYSDVCASQTEAEGLGLEGRPDVVVLWSGAWEVYDQEYQGVTYRVGTPMAAAFVEARLQRRIDRYRAAGLPTVLPLVTCFGGPEVTADYLGSERNDRSRLSWVNARLRAVAARNRGWVRLVDPEDVLCDAEGDALDERPGGGTLRVDGAHFDESSGPWLWNTWLGGQVGAALTTPT